MVREECESVGGVRTTESQTTTHPRLQDGIAKKYHHFYTTSSV